MCVCVSVHGRKEGYYGRFLDTAVGVLHAHQRKKGGQGQAEMLTLHSGSSMKRKLANRGKGRKRRRKKATQQQEEEGWKKRARTKGINKVLLRKFRTVLWKRITLFPSRLMPDGCRTLVLFSRWQPPPFFPPSSVKLSGTTIKQPLSSYPNGRDVLGFAWEIFQTCFTCSKRRKDGVALSTQVHSSGCTHTHTHEGWKSFFFIFFCLFRPLSTKSFIHFSRQPGNWERHIEGVGGP